MVWGVSLQRLCHTVVKVMLEQKLRDVTNSLMQLGRMVVIIEGDGVVYDVAVQGCCRSILYFYPLLLLLAIIQLS